MHNLVAIVIIIFDENGMGEYGPVSRISRQEGGLTFDSFLFD
jgi:hypothetical protein